MNPKLIALVLGVFVGGVLVYADYAPPRSATPVVALCDQQLREPIVRASAGYAYDGASGAVLFEKNADAQLPLASLTKVMTVITALDALGATSTVIISGDALTPEGEYGLRVGETWSAQELADFTLVGSVNDGARALMLAATPLMGGDQARFYDAMNRRARAEGLATMYFINETGLDVSRTTAGAYGSARDVARLFMSTAIRYPGLVERSVIPTDTYTSRSGVTHKVDNTSLIASTIQAPLLSKTGYTDLAGGNLALVYEPLPGHPVSVSVLGSTRDGRDADMRAILAAVTEKLRRVVACAGTL